MKETTFLRHFVRALLRTVWTYLAVASTFITFLPLPLGWRKVVPLGIAVLFVISAYRAAGLLHQQCESDKEQLAKQIEELERRPYGADHRILVEGKLRNLTATGKEILLFLLHHGRFENWALGNELRNRPGFDDQLRQLSSEYLLLRTEEPIPGRAGTNLFWHVNPEFVEVLKDLLYSAGQLQQ